MAWIRWLVDTGSNFPVHLAVAAFFGSAGVMLWNAPTGSVFVALSALLGGTLLNPLRFRGQSPRASETTPARLLTLTTFNLEWTSPRQERSLAYLRDLESDIVVLQEVTDRIRPAIEAIKDRFPHQYGGGTNHVMVLSRHPAREVRPVPLPGRYPDRGLIVRFDIGGVFDLLAVHLQVTRRPSEIELRDRHIRIVASVIDEAHPDLILAGDFNAAPGSFAIADLLRRTTLRGRLWPSPLRATWPSLLGVFGVQIDHALVKGGLRVGRVRSGPRLGSDHRPLTVEILR